MMVSTAVPALVAIGMATLGLTAASAQTAPLPAPHAVTLGAGEQAALRALEVAARGPDRAAQDAALAVARAAVGSNGGRHALGHYQLEIGRARGDAEMIGQAVDLLVAGGLSTPEELPSLMMNQASRAYYKGEYQRTEQILTRIAALQPTDPVVVAEQAQIQALIGMAWTRANRTDLAQAAFGESLSLLSRATQLHRATGRPAPESWYRRGLAVASDRSLTPQALAFGRELVTHYPTPLNWRDVLLVHEKAAASDPALQLDLKRLMRASQALSGERDYLKTAETLKAAKLPGEVKAVIAEGISRGMLSASEPIVRQTNTANDRLAAAEASGLASARTKALAAATGADARLAGDAHYGQARYVQAAELYQAALQKGAEDPNLVNVRLGAALALAGRRAEAEAAFRAVTGPRADLANLWLIWLSRQAA